MVGLQVHRRHEMVSDVVQNTPLSVTIDINVQAKMWKKAASS